MAHNLSSTNGKPAMAYVGARPWHGLGTDLGVTEVDSATMLKAAGLDYTVTLQPVYVRNASGAFDVVEGKNAVTRSDTGAIFNVMSHRWEPIQNVDAFSFFDSVVGNGQAHYRTAGALGLGEKVWIMAQVPGELRIAGDIVSKNILLTNGHDGGTAFTFQMTPIRVVCQNTLNIALNSVNQSKVYRQFHLTGATSRLDPEVAAEIIGLAGTYYSEFKLAADALVSKKLTIKDLDAFVAELFPVNETAATAAKADGFIPAVTINLREQVKDFVVAGRGNAERGSKGTAWGAFNGVVEFVDYARGQDSARASQLLFGQGRALKQRAWDLLN